MEFLTKYGKIIFLMLSGIVYYHIGYQIVRSNFIILILDISILFLLYYYATKHLKFDWISAIFLRLILIASIPSLSDDYFRFIWDGTLVANGQNPFQYLPSELAKNEIYEGMNSKNYYSVYPPILQLIFGFGSLVSKGSILGNIITLRAIIILADLATIYLIIKILASLNLPKKQVQLYAFNPLVILELTGNLHFEAVMLFFLVMSIYFLIISYKSIIYINLSALFFAFSVLIKLLPLIILPAIFYFLGWKKGLKFTLIVGSVIILAFVPFLNWIIITNISQSLDLYFQKFEFNASIYYLVKWLGIFINNNNPIQLAGPLLSMAGASIILWISFKNKLENKNHNQLIINFLIIFSIYFLLATTVHPWYLSTLVLLFSFTNFSYPIIWSALAFLSYSAYRPTGFQENLWLVAVEYLVVFAFIFYELKIKKLANS